MSIAEDFINIESQFELNKVKLSGESIWPVLRGEYFIAMFLAQMEGTVSSVSIPNRSRIRNILRRFYGILNLFGACDYMVFSDVRERKAIGDKFFDKSTDGVSDRLGRKRTIHFEFAKHDHFKLKEVWTKRIASTSLLALLMRFASLFLPKTKLENRQILNEFKERIGIKLNEDPLIKDYLARSIAYRWLFRLYRPKAIFVNRQACDLTVFKVANDMGIKTVEISHGMITAKHTAYNSKLSQNLSFFPKTILVFGEHVRDELRENSIIPLENIVPVGSYYIDHIKNRTQILDRFNSWRQQFKRVFVVSLEYTVEKELIEFIESVAAGCPDDLFALVPRDAHKKFDRPQAKNIVYCTDLLLEGANIYQLIKGADCHITVYSTCALEALALGIPNILVNLKGLAREHFSCLDDGQASFIVDQTSQLVDLLENLDSRFCRDAIEERGSYYIKKDYMGNIDRFIDSFFG